MKTAVCDEGMSSMLLRIVADPERRACLHGILSPFGHQFRNLLNSLKLSLYLAKRGSSEAGMEVWGELECRYLEVQSLFDHLQMIYKPLALTPVRLPLAHLFDEAKEVWAEQLGHRRRQLVTVPPAEAAVGEFDPLRLRQALDAFVAWRARVGSPGEDVTLRWRAENEQMIVEWKEHARRKRGPETPHDSELSLALPLLARVVSDHGGTLNLERHRGVSLTLCWPVVIPHAQRSLSE